VPRRAAVLGGVGLEADSQQEGLRFERGRLPQSHLLRRDARLFADPSKRSTIRYSDVVWRGRSLGDVVEELTDGQQRREFGAHLDPDLRREDFPRLPGWRPH
jgi:hypothetical protein